MGFLSSLMKSRKSYGASTSYKAAQPAPPIRTSRPVMDQMESRPAKRGYVINLGGSEGSIRARANKAASNAMTSAVGAGRKVRHSAKKSMKNAKGASIRIANSAKQTAETGQRLARRSLARGTVKARTLYDKATSNARKMGVVQSRNFV
jgi:hypothetical protein